nr:MAG TPA: hypothetical protein [Caudoviricetes sp.]
MCTTTLEIEDILNVHSAFSMCEWSCTNKHFDTLKSLYIRACAQPDSEEHLMVSRSEFSAFLYCSKILKLRGAYDE